MTTTMTAIERLKASKLAFLERGERNRLVQSVSAPCDPPEGDYEVFNDAAHFGLSWAQHEATYEQLRALEHLATLIGLQAAPQLDQVDPACWVVVMLSDDAEMFQNGELEELKERWFGIDGGGVSTRRQVEGWIAGALEFWRSVKDGV